MNAVEDEPRVDATPGAREEREAWRRLFAEIADGRADALAQLYDLAAGRVYGLAAWRLGSVEDAADVAQDVFVRVAQSADRLRDVVDPRAWLLSVAHRLAVDHVRRRARREAASLDERPFLEPPTGDPVRHLEARAATAALARLPGRERAAIYLRHFADCTFAEIGRITGVPTFTAASRYRLGMKRLRRFLEGSR